MQIAGNDSEIKHDETFYSTFEGLYIDLRRKENRILTDSQLMFLPDVDSSHIHYNEWQIRKRSAQRLIAYLKKKSKPLKILEVGCGNGWLSSKLSAMANSTVIGLDINEVEINQAKRVFKKDNLQFIGKGFNPEMFPNEKFDVILFAASIQYFPSLKNILQNALNCLSEQGEVHIIDTRFYKPAEIENAARRCKNYYLMLGYPEMANYYFHHSINDLKAFNYKALLNPLRVISRISKREPFYWIAVKH